MAKTSVTKRIPIRDRIRAANSEYTRTVGLHNSLMAYANATPPSNIDEQFRRRLHSGEAPGDILDEYVEAKARENLQGQFGKLIGDVLQKTVVPTSAEEQFTDTALDMCRAELDAIMGRVAEHRKLIEKHSDSAEDALANGGIENWQTVDQILSDYEQVRDEYRRQIRLQDPALGGTVISTFECRDFVDVSPYWGRKRATTAVLEGYPDTEIISWFQAGRGTRTGTRAEWLLTVADHEPWMPDSGQVGALAHVVEQLCRRQWHTGNVSGDRRWFDEQMEQLNFIAHDTPIPDRPAGARRLA